MAWAGPRVFLSNFPLPYSWNLLVSIKSNLLQADWFKLASLGFLLSSSPGKKSLWILYTAMDSTQHELLSSTELSSTALNWNAPHWTQPNRIDLLSITFSLTCFFFISFSFLLDILFICISNVIPFPGFYSGNSHHIFPSPCIYEGAPSPIHPSTSALLP